MNNATFIPALLLSSLLLLLSGCYQNSASPPTVKHPYDAAHLVYVRSADAVEVPTNEIQVVGTKWTDNERDLADALGLTVWPFKVILPAHADSLWVKVGLESPGKPVKPVFGQEFNLRWNDFPSGTAFPVVLTINPVGSANGEGIFNAGNLKFFIKSPVSQTAQVVPNPFYKSTNGLATYPAGSSWHNNLLSESWRTNDLVVTFQLFVRTNQGDSTNLAGTPTK